MNCPSCNTALDADARFCGACGHALDAAAQHAPADPYAAMIGRRIAGRYRILAKLGEGGMGAVFRAEQISLKRVVALKLLRPELSANAELVRRFNAEAELAAKLSHPNTVTLYDFGQDDDGTLFIAMEFIEGRSLRDVLATEGALPMARVLRIGEQVCSSLADAHAHSIVHRDLKPDNVMLSARGKKTDIVRVLDFGIAKLRDQGGDITAMPMTQAGALLGTPQYMAPEQIRGEAVDSRTDVYAMGVILYEMVTGALPFQGGSLMAILSKHLTEAPVAPSQRRPDLGVPAQMDRIVMAALEKDPARRPASMEALGNMLAALAPMANMGGMATGPSMGGVGQAATPVGMNQASTPAGMGHVSTPAPISTPAPVSAYGVVGHAAHVVGTPPPGQFPGPMGAAPRRSRVGLWLGLGAVVAAAVAIAVVMVLRKAGNPEPEPVEPVAVESAEPVAPVADKPETPTVSSDFFVAPKRKLYSDSQGSKPGQATVSKYVSPLYGYELDLPAGFVQDPTSTAAFMRFIKNPDSNPEAILVLHVDFDPAMFDDSTLTGMLKALARQADVTLRDTSFRKIQGRRRLTGIVDEPTYGLRFEFALLPCKDQGMMVMYGTRKDAFESSKDVRRRLFEKRITIP